MNPIAKSKRVESDKRAYYSPERMLQYGQRYKEFHLPSIELIFNLVYTYEVTAAHIARIFAKHDLSLSAFNVLMILSRSDRKGLPLHEVGELLLVSRANVTGLVDCLERKGLVERTADEGDRRVRIVRITRAGEELLESVLPGYYGEVREIFAGLSDAEKATLSEFLSKLRGSVMNSLEKRSGEGKGP